MLTHYDDESAEGIDPRLTEPAMEDDDYYYFPVSAKPPSRNTQIRAPTPSKSRAKRVQVKTACSKLLVTQQTAGNHAKSAARSVRASDVFSTICRTHVLMYHAPALNILAEEKMECVSYELLAICLLCKVC